MAETLGSLCDKLTIVKLKQYHSQEEERLKSLAGQEVQLQEEIDEFVRRALVGGIPIERLTFASNKVWKKEGNEVADVQGTLGTVFSMLADVNCQLWHEQEKVYAFESVPPEEKNAVVKQLAVLNLSRNRCIDEIDRQFSAVVRERLASSSS
ncbi:hypothetical protein IAD21_02706 [Abditibacteriota bacterium]|nr:hypothetical protein IAD21_02706 [Abditibacteriota bacterium]